MGRGYNFMADFIGVVLVCILINVVKPISVLFFGVGVGILGAIDYISQNKLPIKKFWLLILEIISTIFISLSVLQEVPSYFVFIVLAGMCMFYSLYNLKDANKISAVILLVLASLIIGIAFYNVLDVFRFVVFMIGLISYFSIIYLKKPVLIN